MFPLPGAGLPYCVHTTQSLQGAKHNSQRGPNTICTEMDSSITRYSRLSHCGISTRWSLRSLSAQTVLWFYDAAASISLLNHCIPHHSRKNPCCWSSICALWQSQMLKLRPERYHWGHWTGILHSHKEERKFIKWTIQLKGKLPKVKY